MPEDLALRYGDRPLSASLPLPSSKGGDSSVVREPLVERPARLSQTMTSVAESPLRRSYAEDPRARRSESDRMFVSEGPDGRRIVTREGSDGQRYAVSATESDRVLGGLSGARTDLARLVPPHLDWAENGLLDSGAYYLVGSGNSGASSAFLCLAGIYGCSMLAEYF